MNDLVSVVLVQCFGARFESSVGIVYGRYKKKVYFSWLWIIRCINLCDVEGVEDQDMVVVLGQGDDVALQGDLEPAAATHLDVGTLELSHQGPVSLEDGHVEAVAMTVTHQDVTSVADVNAVRIVGDVLTAYTPHEHTFLVEDNHTVALHINNTPIYQICYPTYQAGHIKMSLQSKIH